MSTQTEHLHLDLREAADIFNPLSTNANFESLDNIIYEIQTKGGVPTYTTTASANLLKLSQNPTPNVTVFKFVAAGDANSWSYQETVNNIVSLDGAQKTVKAGEMYVAWVNSANAMVVIAWPDVVNAQTFDGKAPAEWATKAQLDEVNQTAVNATTTAQAAATVANNALEVAQAAGMKLTKVYESTATSMASGNITLTGVPADRKMFIIVAHCSVVSPVVCGILFPDSKTYYVSGLATGVSNFPAFVRRSFKLLDDQTIQVGNGELAAINGAFSTNQNSIVVSEIYAIS